MTMIYYWMAETDTGKFGQKMSFYCVFYLFLRFENYDF